MHKSEEFSGKTALVTGASRGIGRAAAMLLTSRGAAVVMVARGGVELSSVASEFRRDFGARVITLVGDVANPNVARAAVERTVHEFGRIDILANIAGAFPTALLEDTTDAHFAESIDVNLTATFNFCRAVLPVMKLQGGGAVVNMSSTAARFPTPGLSAYSASKAGVEAFTRAIAAEYAPAVRINAVSAGPTLTETVRALIESDRTGAVAAVTRALPLQRMAEPAEIAEAILFLASDRASFITGQVLHANGGGIMA